MQPAMARTTSGRALPCASMLARANTRSSAFSRTAQVLIRITSAAAGSSRARVAAAIEQPQHQIAVGDVHLAAVRLEIDFSRRPARGLR